MGNWKKEDGNPEEVKLLSEQPEFLHLNWATDC